jgi:hypothetical protein
MAAALGAAGDAGMVDSHSEASEAPGADSPERKRKDRRTVQSPSLDKLGRKTEFKMFTTRMRRFLRSAARSIDAAILAWENAHEDAAMLGEDAATFARTLATQESRKCVDSLIEPVLALAPVVELPPSPAAQGSTSGGESSAQERGLREKARKLVEGYIVEASMAATYQRVIHEMGNSIDYKRMNSAYVVGRAGRATHSMPVRIIGDTVDYQTNRVYGRIAKGGAAAIMHALLRKEDSACSDLETLPQSGDETPWNAAEW